MPRPALETLTPREREILTMIGEGDSLPEIAHKLHRSLKTIESHRLSLGRKLNASNRVELAKIAISAGLVSVNGSNDVGPGKQTDQELSWLNQINDAISDKIGHEQLEAFCMAASQLPGVSFAAICTPERTPAGDPKPYNRVMMAISENGEIGKPVRYKAAKTPCQQIIEEGECCFEQGIRRAYPEDKWLESISAESYFGVQLLTTDGQAIGGVGLIGREQMPKLEELRRVVAFFAPRLAGALMTCIELDALRSQVDLLEYKRIHDDLEPATVTVVEGETDKAVSVALARIMRRTHGMAGVTFLRGIVDAMAQTFDLSHLGICRVDHVPTTQTLSSLIFVVDHQIADTINYKSLDTPCAVVLDEGQYYIETCAGKQFPNDTLLVKNQIDSYVGVRVTAPSGEILGLIWMGSRGRIAAPQTLVQVAKYFAPRIGAEIEQLIRYEGLLQQQEELELRNQTE